MKIFFSDPSIATKIEKKFKAKIIFFVNVIFFKKVPLVDPRRFLKYFTLGI